MVQHAENDSILEVNLRSILRNKTFCFLTIVQKSVAEDKNFILNGNKTYLLKYVLLTIK